jgi:hypothetical protein
MSQQKKVPSLCSFPFAQFKNEPAEKTTNLMFLPFCAVKK